MSSDTDSSDDVENNTAAFRDQLLEAFDEMTYPIVMPAELSAGFRSWDNTSFGGREELTSARLQTLLSDDPSSFPYEDPNEIVEAVLQQLQQREIITCNDETGLYELVD